MISTNTNDKIIIRNVRENKMSNELMVIKSEYIKMHLNVFHVAFSVYLNLSCLWPNLGLVFLLFSIGLSCIVVH